MAAEKPHWTEIVKNIAEIIALGVAAIWAYFNFSIKDKPTLEVREKVSSTLSWERSARSSYTHAEFYVTMENTGTTKFEIAKVKLYARTFDEIGLDSGGQIQYFDFGRIKTQGDSIYEKTFGNDNQKTAGWKGPFIGPFVEGALWNENFEFLMKLNSKKMVLFYIEFYQKGEEEPFDWTYHWDYIGGMDTGGGKSNLPRSH